MTYPAAAMIFLFLGCCDAVLCVVPDLRLVIAGGILTTTLALVTISRL